MLLLFMQPSLHGAALKPENGASWAHVLRADGASIGDLCCAILAQAWTCSYVEAVCTEVEKQKPCCSHSFALLV